MSPHFVGLDCTNCGAKLDAYNDMGRFARSYCGTRMVVERRGGTVSLKSVADAVKRAHAGIEKAAAN